MPLFEYQCAACGEEFEELVSGKNEKVTCPECKSDNVSRKLSVFASSGSAGGGTCSAPSGSGFR